MKTSKFIAANTTNAGVVGAVTAGVRLLYGLVLSNNNAAAAFLKLYDKATAPTVGTDVPLMTIAAPIGVGTTVTVMFPRPLEFYNGIAYATTAGIQDADATAVSANQLSAHFLWD